MVNAAVATIALKLAEWFSLAIVALLCSFLALGGHSLVADFTLRGLFKFVGPVLLIFYSSYEMVEVRKHFVQYSIKCTNFPI